MTVLDNTPRDQYTATGGQVAFPYTFEIAAEGDIAVLQNGVLLSLGTGAGEYAVSGVGVDTGGNVTLVTGATSGDIITIYRDMAYERLTAYTNAGDFLAADVNNDFDRLWLALQQNGGDLDRVLIAPNTDPTSIDMTIPDKATRLGKLLQFNATTGNPEVVSPTSIVGSGAFNVYNFVGNGSTTAFTLGSDPGVENNTQVYIDGVYQQKNTYTVSGTTLTFSAAPPNLSTIEVMVVTAQPVNTVNAASVSFTQAGSTDTRTVQAKLEESISVKDFGAVGDGVTDDTAALQAVLDTYSGTGTIIIFPQATYKTSAQLSFYQQRIRSDDATISCTDNTVIALSISGGAFYTDIKGKLTVTRATPYTGVEAQISGAYGVKIRCRVDIDHLISSGHYWDGINVNSTTNLNKCRIYLAQATSNARHGIYFDGTQDDTSVWRFNFLCQSNYASGIYFEDAHPARQFYGHGYTEDNCADGTSWGAYLGGLSSSEMYIYSEEQTSNNEINLPAAGGSGNKIFSGRANADSNDQVTSQLFQGSRTLHHGATGSTRTDQFVNLTDNAAKYWDILIATSDGDLFQERYLGNGEKWNAVQDAGAGAYTEFRQTDSEITLYKSNGSIASNTPVVATDAWSLYFAGNTGTGTRTQKTNFGHVRAYASSVGGGNKGNGVLKLGTSQASSSSADRVEIASTYMIPTTGGAMNLGGASNLWAEVFAANATINTSDDREKTYLTIEDAERQCALEIKANLRKFKWNDSIAEKGDAARIHFGASAQTIKAIFESHGLDAHQYGLFCYDEWDAKEAIPAEFDDEGNMIYEGVPAKEAGNRYGVRYSELLCFIMAAI